MMNVNQIAPAAVSGKGPWKLAPPSVFGAGIGGAVSEEALVFAVPTNDELRSQAIRAHEYGHLAIARNKKRVTSRENRALAKAGIPDIWIQAAGDLLVNQFLLNAGVELVQHLPLALPEELREDRAIQATTYLRSCMLHCHNEINQAANLTNLEKNYLQSQVPKILYAPKKKLPALLANLARIFPTADSKKDSTELGDDKRGPSTEQPAGLGELDKLTRSSSPVTRRAGTTPKLGEWCDMETVYLEPVARCGRLKKNRYSSVGAFRFPHRALLPAGDGNCFSLRRRYKGGTFLIDRSGSMHIREEDLEQLIRAIPHATIAAYDSDCNTRGKLVVFAQNGEMGDLDDPRANPAGQGNGVDGPALEWLLTQESPRIWVCDGEVTGVKDVNSINLIQETRILEERGKVTRIRSMKLALKTYAPSTLDDEVVKS